MACAIMYGLIQLISDAAPISIVPAIKPPSKIARMSLLCICPSKVRRGYTAQASLRLQTPVSGGFPLDYFCETLPRGDSENAWPVSAASRVGLCGRRGIRHHG